MSQELNAVADNFDKRHWPGEDASEQEMNSMINQVRDNLSDGEMGRLARAGSNAAQRALVDSMREQRGEREARDVIFDTETWAEEPEKAISVLRQTSAEFEEADMSEAAYNMEDPVETMIDNGHADQLRDYLNIVDFPESEANEIFDSKYQEKMDGTSDEKLEAARLAQQFGDNQRAKDAAVDVLKWYSVDDRQEEGITNRYNAEKIVEAAQIAGGKGEKLADDAIKTGYQTEIEEGEYRNAAKLAQACNESSVGIGRKEELQAAKKWIEQKVDDGDYKKGIEIASEHQLGGEYMQDVLTKAVLNDEINEDTYENMSEELEGYDSLDYVESAGVDHVPNESSNKGAIGKLKSSLGL